MLQEEARPVAIALFGKPSAIFHLGFDRPLLAKRDWYTNCRTPYAIGIFNILDKISTWPEVKRLEFLIASVDDPILCLQSNLDRQTFPITQKPSTLCNNLQTQTIYSFTAKESTSLEG